MQNIDINEAKRRLPELIEQASSGDEVIITKSGQPIVKLVAITKHKHLEESANHCPKYDRETSGNKQSCFLSNVSY